MHALMLLIATAAVGIDAGWQRMPEGGMEYIIQLDPQTLETLRSGEAIQSDVPPSAGEIRSYRIVVGTKKLPRDTPPPTTKTAESKNLPARENQSAPPEKLQIEPTDKLAPAQPALFQQSDAAARVSPLPKPDVPEPEPVEPAKPWLPLTFTMLGLFASLGGNVYLIWIAWDSRRQWRAARHAVA